MALFADDLVARAARLVEACRAASVMVATAESCTGGLLAGLLTEIAGSSLAVDRSFITYSNEAKIEMLGVPAGVITRHGAVSAETARSMAQGALDRSRADVAVAITGIAGPGGGGPEKPVGLVHFACARRGADPVMRRCAFGELGRQAIRLAAVDTGLRLFEDALAAITAP